MSEQDTGKVVKDPCIDCREGVVGKTGGVQCNFCEEWCHPKCAKVSTQHLKALKEQPGMTWTCVKCRKVAMKLQQQVHALQRNIDELKTTVNTMKDDISKHDNRLKVVERKVKEVDKNVIINESLDAQVDEQREQEARRNNVVIHQIPEADQNLPISDKKAADIDNVITLLGSIDCKIQEEDVKFIVRLNSKQAANGSNIVRPILMGLKNSQKRDEIIQKAYLLIQTESEKSIIPDLTPFQRAHENKLRQKVIHFNNEMDEEERLNWEWRLVGIRGQKRMIKARKRQEQRPITVNVRGRGRGRGLSNRGRGGAPRGASSRSRQRNQPTNRTTPQITSLNSSVMMPGSEDENEDVITVSQIPDQTK